MCADQKYAFVFAAADIEAGQELLVDYAPDYPCVDVRSCVRARMQVAKRREYIRLKYGFDCACPKCTNQSD